MDNNKIICTIKQMTIDYIINEDLNSIPETYYLRLMLSRLS